MQLITKAGLHWIGPIIVAIKIWWNCSLGMVEKLEHHGPVRLLEYGFKIQMVVIHMYKETSVLFNFNKSDHSKLGTSPTSMQN